MKKIFNKENFSFLNPKVLFLQIFILALLVLPNISSAADGEIIITRTACNSVDIYLNGGSQAVAGYGPWHPINSDSSNAWFQVWMFGPSGQSQSGYFQGVGTTRSYNNLPGGDYTFQIHYFGNGGAPGEVEQIFGNSTVPDFAANCVPVVNAGPDQTITLPTNSVSVSATATDADGYIYTRTWNKSASTPAAASFTIASPGSNATTISNLQAGNYTFRFTAYDDQLNFVSDEMNVTVNPAPVTTYIATPSAGSGGTMNPSSGVNVNAGNSTSFTVTPNSGYRISSVSGCNGTAYNNPSALTTAYTYNTGAINADCTVTSAFVFVSAPAPVTTLNASPTTVSSGGSSTLTWSASNTPTSCTASAVPANGQWTGSKTPASGGSQSITGLTTTTTFSLYCNNASGQSNTATATVTVSGPVTYIATPSAGSGGTMNPSSGVNVNAGNSTSFTVTPNSGYRISSVSGCNGTAYNNPSALTTAYTYNTGAINADCTVTSAFVLTGGGLPSVNLTATPSTINSGDTVTLNWTSSNATACNASSSPANGQWLGSVPLNGPLSVTGVTQNTTFTVTCSSGGNNAVSNSSVTVSGTPQAELTASTPTPGTATATVSQVFTSTVYNNGDLSTGNAFDNRARWATGSNGTGTVSTISITSTPALTALNQRDVTFAHTFPSAGTFSVSLCVDHNTAVSEFDENNNCSPWRNVTVAAAPVMSGTLTGPASCNIAQGSSSCNAALTWTTTNPQGTSGVTSDKNNSGVLTTNFSVATGNNSPAPTAVPIPYGSRRFDLYNNSSWLNNPGLTITAACTGGTGWNSATSTCQNTAAPSVTLPTHTAITTTGATLGATVASLGVPNSITARGTCWATTTNPTTNCLPEGVVSTGAFSHVRTGMPSNTLIYYRGYVDHPVSGRVYSTNGSFTTTASATAPTLTTSAVSSITSTTATGGGTIVSNGGSTITVSGIVWSTSPNPTTALSTKTTDGWATGGPWVSNMTGLTANTLYYVRAYATNGVGTSYGAPVTFTTTASATAPTLTTSAVSSITSTTATGGGTIVSNGGSTITVSGIVWSTSPNPTTALSTKTTDGWATGGPWVSNMTGLTANTLYYVRAYATNGVGTSYGAPVQFTTANSSGPSGTISVVGCSIQPNASTCPASVTWSTSNLTAGPTEVTRNNPNNTSVSFLTSGTNFANNVTYGSSTFFIYHNNSPTPLATSNVIVVDCVANHYWNNTSCVPNAPTAPNVTLSATPPSIIPPATSTLQWSSSNADSCTSTDFNTGGATSGSVAVAPIVSTKYSIACLNNASGIITPAEVWVMIGSSGPKIPGYKEN